jgi:hypothetical protein
MRRPLSARPEQIRRQLFQNRIGCIVQEACPYLGRPEAEYIPLRSRHAEESPGEADGVDDLGWGVISAHC